MKDGAAASTAYKSRHVNILSEDLLFTVPDSPRRDASKTVQFVVDLPANHLERVAQEITGRQAMTTPRVEFIAQLLDALQRKSR